MYVLALVLVLDLMLVLFSGAGFEAGLFHLVAHSIRMRRDAMFTQCIIVSKGDYSSGP